VSGGSGSLSAGSAKRKEAAAESRMSGLVSEGKDSAKSGRGSPISGEGRSGA